MSVRAAARAALRGRCSPARVASPRSRAASRTTATTTCVDGKQQFVAKCGSCHALKRAGTTGVTGPNLDEAFQQRAPRRLRREHVPGHRLPPDPPPEPQRRRSTRRPARTCAKMPAKLSRARTRRTSRPTSAGAVSQEGQGHGRARDRRRRARSNADRQRPGGGKLVDPRRPDRRPRLQVRLDASRQRRPGRDRVARTSRRSTTTSRSRATASTRSGEVVKDGGASKVNVDLKPGNYTFFCSVPGPPRGRHGGQAHRQVTRAPSRRGPLGVAASSASYCWPARQKKNASANDHQDDVERRPSARRRAAGRRAGSARGRAGRSP